MVTGARQVGKTTMLRHIGALSKCNYVSLDNPIERDLAKNDPLLFLKKYNTPVIIDEIQYAPELLPYIKLAVDEADYKKRPNDSTGLFTLTGSQLFPMMKNVSESLAGRVSVMQLCTLSENEIRGCDDTPFLPSFEQIMQKENKRKYEDTWLFDAIFRGKFPRLISQPGIDANEYYSGYLQTYLERDIRDMITIRDESRFSRFLSCAAARTGQELVYEDIAKDVEVDIKTAQSWMSLLKASGLVYFLQPYSNNAIKRIIKRPKLYFLDTGLACFLAKYVDSRTLEVSAYSGNIFETYVIGEIIKSYMNCGKYPDMHLYYYRDSNKKEIDLLILQNGIIHPIEIKKSANPGKEIVRNFSVLDPLEKAGLQVGEGGILCMMDKVIPINNRNCFIPLHCI